jgi:hypothetical protein
MNLWSYINNVSNKPPTLYFLLESIVNYGKDDKTKIKDLAKEGHSRIFNFEYPLTDKIDKEDFEVNILNHYLTRRIGAETFTLFQINLNAKLNEIMPFYNKMFDSIDGIDLLNDITTRTGNDTSNTSNSLENSSTTTSDKRYSDTPQNNLQNVKDGAYVTEYNFDTNIDNSNSEGSSENTRNYAETITKSPSNKIDKLKTLQSEVKSIYTLIYKDLDDLFYGLL